MTTNTRPAPVADVDTRTHIMERWLKAALFNDAHVWVDRPYIGQKHRTIMVKGFGGATAEALRVNLYSDRTDVTVDTVGTWESTEPMDALSAMWYVKQRLTEN